MLGSRIDGTVVVIECALSINLTALTLEQVLNKRHKLVKDMGDGMVLELRTALAGSGVEARQMEKLRGDLDSKVLHEAPQAFNEDASFGRAVEWALKLKQEAGNEEAILQEFQRDPAALALGVEFVLAKLEDSEWRVRQAAVQTLGKLAADALAPHAAAVVAKLEDTNENVRQAAVQTLGKLPADVLALHAAAVVAKLEDSNENVRQAAVETLGKLAADVLASHAAAVVAKLEDTDEDVRRVAVETLGKLPADALPPHAAAVVAKLEDSHAGVQQAAVQTLGKLELAELTKYKEALQKLAEQDAEAVVQMTAHVVLHKIEPTAGHIAAILSRLEDSEWSVRLAVVRALGKLEPLERANYAEALQKRANEDLDSGVRDAAREALVQLQAS